MAMKKLLVVGSPLVFAVLGFMLAHPESRRIMRGDYEFDQWMFIPVSSKTWLLVFLLGIIGGCTGWLFYRFYRKVGKKNETEEKNIS